MAGTTAGSGEGWSSRWAFVLAAVGAAVGLGNIWRFPTLAGENGGGAFVLVYIACVILIGLPMVLVRSADRSPRPERCLPQRRQGCRGFRRQHQSGAFSADWA